MVLTATWSFRPAEVTCRCVAASSSHPSSLRAPPRLQPLRPTYTASAPASSAARTASGLPAGARRTGAAITSRPKDPLPRGVRTPASGILRAVDYSSRRVILGSVSGTESRGLSICSLPIMPGDGRTPESLGDLPHDGPPAAVLRVGPENDHDRADERRLDPSAAVRPPDARRQLSERAADHRRSGAPDLRHDEHDVRPRPADGALGARPHHALIEGSPLRLREADPVGRTPPSPLYGCGRRGPAGGGRRAGAGPAARRVR